MSTIAQRFVACCVVVAGARLVAAQEPPSRHDFGPAQIPLRLPAVSGDVLYPRDSAVSPNVAVPPQHSVALLDITAPPGEWGGVDPWYCQVLPDGLVYRPYLAGIKEARFAGVWNHEKDLGWVWDVALGGRVGLLRYGTDRSDRPEGWQLDFEGAAFPRLDLENQWDVMSADFRGGVPLTFGWARFEAKLAYYHLSSHLGDEYMIRHPEALRINYVRDAIVLGASYDLGRDVRVYAESGWSFNTDGGAEPWEFQFGIDYSPVVFHAFRGSPFFACNGHLREEFGFGGNLVVQAGWQWRGRSGHLFRTGMQYFNGRSSQYEFVDQHEEQLGWGIWYDY